MSNQRTIYYTFQSTRGLDGPRDAGACRHVDASAVSIHARAGWPARLTSALLPTWTEEFQSTRGLDGPRDESEAVWLSYRDVSIHARAGWPARPAMMMLLGLRIGVSIHARAGWPARRLFPGVLAHRLDGFNPRAGWMARATPAAPQCCPPSPVSIHARAGWPARRWHHRWPSRMDSFNPRAGWMARATRFAVVGAWVFVFQSTRGLDGPRDQGSLAATAGMPGFNPRAGWMARATVASLSNANN